MPPHVSWLNGAWAAHAARARRRRILAKERGDALTERVPVGFLSRADVVVLQNGLGDAALDLCPLFGGQRFFVVVIEAQAVRANQRPGLRHVAAQNFAQRSMQEMGRCVVACNVPTAGGVDLSGHRIADAGMAFDHAPAVDHHAFHRAADVLDDDLPIGSQNAPGIGDLAAGLNVEACVFQGQLHILAGRGAGIQSIPTHDACHTRLDFQCAVWVKPERAATFLFGNPILENGVEQGVLVGFHLEIAGGPSARALRFTRDPVAFFVHRHAVFCDDVAGDLKGQSQRVVQEEGRIAGDDGLATRLASAMTSSSAPILDRGCGRKRSSSLVRVALIKSVRDGNSEDVTHHLDDEIGESAKGRVKPSLRP